MGVKRVFETFNRVHTLAANINLPLITGMVALQTNARMFNKNLLLQLVMDVRVISDASRCARRPARREKRSLPIVAGVSSPRGRRITRGMDFVESSSYRELCREFHADGNARQWRNW